MHSYAQLRPGRGFKPIRAALYYSQRLVISPTLRNAVARVAGSIIDGLYSDSVSAHSGTEVQPELDALRRNGISRLDDLMSGEDVGAIVDYLMPKPVVGCGGEVLTLAAARSTHNMAAYSLATLMGCKPIRDFANAQTLLQIARGYLGCTPTISSIGVRWSFPKPTRLDCTQLFHRDLDDWRFMKAFMYLTDVDAESGPHKYVRGTHKTPSRLRAKPYDSRDVERIYGLETIETVTGKKGTTFIADTFGIHCGVPPTETPRLILQVQYSVLPIYAFRYEPLDLPLNSSESAYVNRLLLQSSSAA